mmetsp:Transcript_2389/g.9231  ORF Transcript_2389/g.9231 Transcript_2389/m.9231 type:complete len:255 (+) Transcript_2389:668-1432(+)
MARTLACDLYSSLLPSKGLAATAHRVSVSSNASLSRDPGSTSASLFIESSSLFIDSSSRESSFATLPLSAGSAISPARANVSLITRTSALRDAFRSRSVDAATARCSAHRARCASASPLTTNPSDSCAARTHRVNATCVDETFTSAHLATLTMREESARSRSMSGLGTSDGPSAGDDGSGDDGSGVSSLSRDFGAHPSVAPATSPVANRSLRPSSAGSHSFEVLLSQARRNARVAISTSSALIAPASAPASASC